MYKHILIFFLLTFSLSNFAQRTCGTMDNLANQEKNNPQLKINIENLEKLIRRYESDPKYRTENILTIPVVFHVIHNGDAIGTNENISDSYINAQIAQLNADYAKLNSDFSQNPSVFQGVAADTKVQFCLAQQDPYGDCTTGIDRQYFSSATWAETAIESTLKPNTIWDASSYFNVWTVIFGGASAGLLGYAQFPGGSNSTDGVVVLYSSVGSLTTPNSTGGVYGYGRTLTHESGHYFNLLHIWGDDSGACTGTDNVSDTPNQGSENYSCPTFPNVSCSNGPNGDMFMDYMDYVDDQCMHMFTTGQKTRMRAVLEGGPRTSLVTSAGCTPATGTCYCAAMGSTSGSKISNVSFAGINKNSTGTRGYENFMTMTGNVNKGQSYTFNSTQTTGSSYQEIVWIDYNQDGDFEDAGEQVWSGSPSGTSYTGSVAIPNSASLGTTRMRVRLYSTNSSYYPNTTPCSYSGRGQVEDYAISIAASLPTEYSKYEVILENNNNAKLSWATTSEIRNKGFQIEMSLNSTNKFVDKGFVAANEDLMYNYYINDLSNGTYYFRLKQLDFDGGFTYSSVKSLTIKDSKSNLSIYPNPTSDLLNISISESKITKPKFRIYNELGDSFQITHSETSFNEFQVDVSHLRNGIYILEVINDNLIEKKRFVIN